MTAECWARCAACAVDFRIGVTVPCPVGVFLAGLKHARCPTCGTSRNLQVYEPGRRPPAASVVLEAHP